MTGSPAIVLAEKIEQERREEASGDLSPEQAELIRENERLRRQLARNNMTPEQRQLFQERNALYRHLQQIGGLSTESGIVERNESLKILIKCST